MVYDRLLHPHESYGACRASIVIQAIANVKAWKVVSEQFGASYLSATALLLPNAIIVGITKQVHGDTITALSGINRDHGMQGGALCGPVITIGNHQYVLSMPIDLIETGALTIYQWCLTEGLGDQDADRRSCTESGSTESAPSESGTTGERPAGSGRDETSDPGAKP